jgi:endoglucanase
MSINMLRFFFFLFFLYFSFDSIGQKTLKKIEVRGNKFVDSKENEVFLRGVNISEPSNLDQKGKWNKAYFEEIRRWGANCVRIPVHPSSWRRLGPEKYLALIKNGVKWAAECKMYVVMDWHSIGNLKDEKFQAAMYETTIIETQEFWKKIAQNFGGNTTVAFYELFNEPTTGSGKYGECTWEEWLKINEDLVTTIRREKAIGIPLIGGFNWAYDLKEVLAKPLNSSNIAYISHPYPMKREKPWEPKWQEDWAHVKEKYPVFLTEIGFCGAEEKGAHIPVISDESYGDAIIAFCDQKGLSWLVWVFDANWAPQMFSDDKFTPTRNGKHFKKALLDRNKP